MSAGAAAKSAAGRAGAGFHSSASVIECPHCKRDTRLYPGDLFKLRDDATGLVCPQCGAEFSCVQTVVLVYQSRLTRRPRDGAES